MVTINPGQNYTAKVSVTNTSRKNGMAIPAFFTLTLKGALGDINLTDQQAIHDFQPNETFEFEFNFYIPIPASGQSGNLIATLLAPDNSQVGQATLNLTAGGTGVGNLVVLSNPPGATIFINGTSIEQVTPWSAQVLSGSFNIKLIKGGYQEWSTQVVINNAESKEVSANLTPVYVPPDHIQTGATTEWPINVTVGNFPSNHQLSIRYWLQKVGTGYVPADINHSAVQALPAVSGQRFSSIPITAVDSYYNYPLAPGQYYLIVQVRDYHVEPYGSDLASYDDIASQQQLGPFTVG